MHDIERQIYTPIARALRTAFPGINVSDEYVPAPSSFPHVSIVEADNYASSDHLDSGDAERYSTLLYEVNVYSAKATGKKTECREIMAFISQMLYAVNFTRTSNTPTPNAQDASIYRLTARFRAETDGENLYRI